MRRLAKDSVIYGLGSVANQALGFLLLPLYTRHLTPADYGTYAILGAAGTVVSLIATLGVHSGMARIFYLFPSDEERGSVAFTAVTFAWVAAGLVCAVLLGGATPLASLVLDDATATPWVRLATLIYSLSAVNAVALATLQVHQRPRAYVTCSGLGLLTSCCISIWLVAHCGRGIDGVLQGQLSGMLVQLGLASLASLRSFVPRLHRTALRDMLAFSVPILPTNLFAWGLGLADRWFLKTYGTFTDVGIYALGYRFGGALDTLFVAPFALAWFPYLYSIAEQPDHREIVARVLEYYALIAGTLVLGLGLFGGDVIRLMSDPSFWEAEHVVFWVGLGVLFRGMVFITITGMNLVRKNHWSSLVYAGGVLLNLGLLRALVPALGTAGAAYATVVTFVGINAGFAAFSNSYHPIPFRWAKILLLVATLVAVHAAARFVPPEPLLLSIALKLVLVALFPLVLFAGRFFDARDLARVRSMLGIGESPA